MFSRKFPCLVIVFQSCFEYFIDLFENRISSNTDCDSIIKIASSKPIQTSSPSTNKLSIAKQLHAIRHRPSNLSFIYSVKFFLTRHQKEFICFKHRQTDSNQLKRFQQHSTYDVTYDVFVIDTTNAINKRFLKKKKKKKRTRKKKKGELRATPKRGKEYFPLT